MRLTCSVARGAEQGAARQAVLGSRVHRKQGVAQGLRHRLGGIIDHAVEGAVQAIAQPVVLRGRRNVRDRLCGARSNVALKGAVKTVAQPVVLQRSASQHRLSAGTSS